MVTGEAAKDRLIAVQRAELEALQAQIEDLKAELKRSKRFRRRVRRRGLRGHPCPL